MNDREPRLNSLGINVKIKIDYSYIIVGLVTFVGDSARGILFPVLWPLCQVLILFIYELKILM
jgi:hypothetical protein